MDIAKAETLDTINDIAVIPDEVAVTRVRRGNLKAFEIIMRRYNQQLFRVARSIIHDNDTAQDAVQQAYIAAYLKLDSYLPNSHFGAWLTRITINEALMIKRKPDNRVAEIKEWLDDERLTGADSDPATQHANNELAVLIETAIEQLPEEFRYVFVLRDIQQLSIKETADILDIRETTVKTRLHRARKLMKTTLNQHIEQAGMHVYEFAGHRCDCMVKTVLNKLNGLSS